MLMNSYSLMLEICSTMALIVLITNKNHLLMSLLALESFMLSLVILIPMNMMMSNLQSMYISVILLSIGACEASLGLALMVMMSRTYGSDLMKSLSMSKC